MVPRLGALALALAVTLVPAAADERKTVKLDDMTVSYGDEGAGQPLVLIHGGGLSSRMWQWFAPAALASSDPGYRVLTPDTRGHGGTDDPGARFGYEQAADDLAGFVKALDLEDPILIGYSDGGVIALNALVRHPGLAKAAVIGGASHKVASDAHYFAGLLSFYGFDTPGALPDAALDALATAKPDMVERFRAMHGTAAEPERWRDLYKTAWPVWTAPFTVEPARLAGVVAPVLVLLAEDDEFFTPEQALELSKLLPKGELAILPGAGHAVFRDRADQFNALVLDFLARLGR